MKHENKVALAFLRGEKAKDHNTRSTGVDLFLPDSHIAKRVGGKIYISNAGYLTPTTRSRLNDLGAGITQKRFVWTWKDGEFFPDNTFVLLEKPATH